MKKSALLLPVALLLTMQLNAQYEYYLPSSTYFQANDIRTSFSANGTMFWDGVHADNYIVPYVDEQSPSTIYNGSLWLGVMDGDSLRLAMQMFGADYYPGPLNPATGKPYGQADLVHFNQVWSVERYDVEQHITDFEENRVLDKPIISVVGWPGNGNPYFRTIHGFDLPQTPQGAAPFFDRNSDGIYNAFDGDYPLPEGMAAGVIPEQMVWLVYNDAAGPHEESNGLPLGMEVQLTAWAFRCLENPLLNNTLFVSQKIINRSGRDYKNVRAGVWTDIDLGCNYDDYAGCAPNINTYFGYNATPFDPLFFNGQYGYGDYPPVQSVSLLNETLAGFKVMYNSGFGSPPPGQTDPAFAIEGYRLLTNAWRDGSPLTYGEDGYDPSLSNPPTDFAFPDDPNDPNGWSQFAEGLPPLDVRNLGIVAYDLFRNGEVKKLDVAYSTHFDGKLNHVEQVSLVYEEVPKIKNWYESSFAKGTCLQPHCEADCVWPGDANNDGIADHFDVLAIGTAYGVQGPTRTSDYTWSPQQAGDWIQELPDGTNFKHADTDGNGLVEAADVNLIKLHHGKFRDGYYDISEYDPGDDIYMQASTDIDNYTVEKADGAFNITVKKQAIDSLVGLAFTIVYDTAYFMSGKTFQSLWSYCLYYLNGYGQNVEKLNGEINFAAFNASGLCPMDDEKLMSIVQLLPRAILPGTSTSLRFTKIRGILANGREVDLGGQDLKLNFEGFDIKKQDEPKSGINVYPNPSTGAFYFNLDKTEVENWRITDATGRLLDVRLDLHQRDFMLDLSEYPSGIYFMRLNRPESVETWILVVQR
jgi:Secretion system C-terminal sorting domain